MTPAKLTLLILGLTFALPSAPVLADWVDAKGEAVIVDGDIAKARNEAIEQAISYASLQSGISFSANQQTEGGRLTANSFEISQAMLTGPIQLISEQVENNRLRVLLRVELYDDPSAQCRTPALKAAILVPETTISHRSQLSQGQLNTLGKAISIQLADKVDNYSSTGFANLQSDTRLAIDSRQAAIQGYRLPNYLANASDSQYVLYPEITDVSTEPAQSSYFGLMRDDPVRQFALTLTLFHGISGEIIWRQGFSASAAWEFERSEIVAPEQDRFWRSAYGRAVDKLLSQATKEMDNALLCRPVLGQIVAKQGATLILNLGRRHGIQVGDELSIVLAKNLSDRFNTSRTTGNNSNTNIKIAQVTENSARAELAGMGTVDNIQISDMVIKTATPKN